MWTLADCLQFFVLKISSFLLLGPIGTGLHLTLAVELPLSYINVTSWFEKIAAQFFSKIAKADFTNNSYIFIAKMFWAVFLSLWTLKSRPNGDKS